MFTAPVEIPWPPTPAAKRAWREDHLSPLKTGRSASANRQRRTGGNKHDLVVYDSERTSFGGISGRRDWLGWPLCRRRQAHGSDLAAQLVPDLLPRPGGPVHPASTQAKPSRGGPQRDSEIETVIRGLVGQRRKYRTLIPGCDAQIKMLIEVQSTLQKATQGLMYMSWNDDFAGPNE
jgi:hypothetical protein